MHLVECVCVLGPFLESSHGSLPFCLDLRLTHLTVRLDSSPYIHSIRCDIGRRLHVRSGHVRLYEILERFHGLYL